MPINPELHFRAGGLRAGFHDPSNYGNYDMQAVRIKMLTPEAKTASMKINYISSYPRRSYDGHLRRSRTRAAYVSAKNHVVRSSDGAVAERYAPQRRVLGRWTGTSQ